MMIMPSSQLDKWQIWLAKCVFLEKKGYKYRPMVIVEITDDAILAVKITSSFEKSYPGDVVLQDWNQEGLLRPSIARTSQVFDLLEFGVASDLPLGNLSDFDRLAIETALRQ